MTNLYYKQVVSGDENKKKQLKIRLELLALVLDQIGSKTWNFFPRTWKGQGDGERKKNTHSNLFKGLQCLFSMGTDWKKAKKKRLLENTSAFFSLAKQDSV